jgi:hypothetical protein
MAATKKKTTKRKRTRDMYELETPGGFVCGFYGVNRGKVVLDTQGCPGGLITIDVKNPKQAVTVRPFKPRKF